jgi:hypothetical protein
MTRPRVQRPDDPDFVVVIRVSHSSKPSPDPWHGTAVKSRPAVVGFDVSGPLGHVLCDLFVDCAAAEQVAISRPWRRVIVSRRCAAARGRKVIVE